VNLVYKIVKVECYSGYKVNERPIAFTHQGDRLEIQEIIDRWYEGGIDSNKPVIDYFKIKATDGNIYLLRYQRDIDVWSLL
jgi:hypothetical protein